MPFVTPLPMTLTNKESVESALTLINHCGITSVSMHGTEICLKSSRIPNL